MSLDATFYGFATVAEARAAWIEQLDRIAETNIEAGVIIDALLDTPPDAPVVFATDADSQAGLWTTHRALEDGFLGSSEWQSTDGQWWELLPSSSDDFAAQCANCCVDYVSACRANASALRDAINACATADDVLAVDLSSGWPSRECSSATLPGTSTDVDLPTEVGGGSVVSMTDADTWYDVGSVTLDTAGRWMVFGEATVVGPDYVSSAYRLYMRIATSSEGGDSPLISGISDWPSVPGGESTWSQMHLTTIDTHSAGTVLKLQTKSSVAGCSTMSSDYSRIYAVKIGPSGGAPPPS